MFKPSLMCLIALLVCASVSSHGQACCGTPQSETSYVDTNANGVGNPNQIGVAFYAELNSSFDGNYVQETTQKAGINTCWYNGSPVPQQPGLNGESPSQYYIPGSTWPIAGNQYGDDMNAESLQVVGGIRSTFASDYSNNTNWSCTITVYQQMNYSCNGEGGPFTSYWANVMDYTVYSNKVYVSRGNASKTVYQ